MSFTPETLLRQWQTLRLLPRHPRNTSARELCEKLAKDGFTVGKRTIERDLQALSTIFPLVLDDRSKPYGWSWQKDAPAFDLPGISNSEAVTLLLAREHLQNLLPRSALDYLQGYFSLAEQTLETLRGRADLASWPDKVRVIPATQPMLPPQVDASVQAVLYEALLTGQQCDVAYHGRDKPAAEHYPIHPLGLVQRGHVLYVVCTIRSYGHIRLLALHRISEATLLEASSEPPPDFDLDEYLGSGALGWFPQETICLEALFDATVAAHLYETPLSDDQRLQPHQDGRVRLTATVRETLQLRWWLQGFGDAVEVVSPFDLRQSLLESTRKVVERYDVSGRPASAEPSAAFDG